MNPANEHPTPEIAIAVPEESSGPEEAEAPNRLFQALKAYVDGEGWTYQTVDPSEGIRIYKLGIKGKNGNYNVVITARSDRNTVCIMIKSPLNVPEEHRNEVALYTVLVNFEMLIGNFAIDLSDGELMYKVAYTADEHTNRMLDVSFSIALQSLDIHFVNIVKIGYGVLSAQEAKNQMDNREKNADSSAPEQ